MDDAEFSEDLEYLVVGYFLRSRFWFGVRVFGGLFERRNVGFFGLGFRSTVAVSLGVGIFR